MTPFNSFYTFSLLCQPSSTSWTIRKQKAKTECYSRWVRWCYILNPFSLNPTLTALIPLHLSSTPTFVGMRTHYIVTVGPCCLFWDFQAWPPFTHSSHTLPLESLHHFHSEPCLPQASSPSGLSSFSSKSFPFKPNSSPNSSWLLPNPYIYS